jgi:hypothetical protein
MQRVLSNESDIATRKTNIPGELHPILAFSPNPGRVLKLVNKTERGQATGIPIFARLRDADGNDLPVDTELALEYDAPGRERPEVVSQVVRNIEEYRILDLTQQRKEEYVDGVKVNLKGHESEGTPSVGATHRDQILISIRSPTEIDWSNSQVSIYEGAVREGPA